MKVQGQCHCGAIRFEAEIDPQAVSICHCTDCQRLSGTAYRANVPAPADGFRLLQGTPRLYVKTAASGAKRAQAFCEVCGSPVYACAAENPTSYNLRIGGLDAPHALAPPRREIWTQRRLPWLSALEDVPQVNGQT